RGKRPYHRNKLKDRSDSRQQDGIRHRHHREKSGIKNKCRDPQQNQSPNILREQEMQIDNNLVDNRLVRSRETSDEPLPHRGTLSDDNEAQNRYQNQTQNLAKAA